MEDRRKKLEELREKKKLRDEELEREKLRNRADKPIESVDSSNPSIDAIIHDVLARNPTTLAHEEPRGPSAQTSPTKDMREPTPKKKPHAALKIQYMDANQINIAGKIKPEPIDQGVQVSFEAAEIQSTGPTPVKKQNTGGEEDEDMLELPQKGRPRRISMVSDVQPMEKRGQNNKKEFTNDELKNIMKSKDFTDFFNRTTKLIEKALDRQDVDILETILETEEGENVDPSRGKELLEPLVTFYDPQHSSNRVVTSIEWSPNLPDLVLASYSQNFEGNPNDPQGVALLWSQALKSRPEFYLYCQSTITASKFNPYSNSIIVGGTYSGQIVLWDLRAKSTPVQRSAMTSQGHAHPVYSLSVVGSQNAHNIVSVSNDGRLCLWNMSMLSTPQKTVDLKYKSAKTQAQPNMQDHPINATCLTFPEEDANNFYVGVEDGNFYSAQIHGNQAKGDNVLESYEGHQGPISSISILPSRQDIASDVSGLVLTSSFDWTVKLWSPKFKTEPLITFESSDDYVYDVSWNRANPSLFTAVDGEGYIDLWDISKDVETPIHHYKAENNAINKARWNSDGTKLMTGNTAGYLKIYGAQKSLLKTSAESIENFETTIINLIKKEDDAV